MHPLASLNGALEALQHRRAQEGPDMELRQRFGTDPTALHRSNFLFLCDDPNLYDAVRLFPFDEEYSRKEELHFRDVCDLVRDWNERERNCRVPLQQCNIPPLVTLRALWDAREQSRRRAGKLISISDRDGAPLSCMLTSCSRNTRFEQQKHAQAQPEGTLHRPSHTHTKQAYIEA